ncbi:MAG: hypothetical protein KIS92_20020 [Planctomycetota bacterium]|nr:hypothetical protein [Planctomycetota bacterium]
MNQVPRVERIKLIHLLRQKLTAAEIAERMGLEVKTVRWRAKSLGMAFAPAKRGRKKKAPPPEASAPKHAMPFDLTEQEVEVEFEE